MSKKISIFLGVFAIMFIQSVLAAPDANQYNLKKTCSACRQEFNKCKTECAKDNTCIVQCKRQRKECIISNNCA